MKRNYLNSITKKKDYKIPYYKRNYLNSITKKKDYKIPYYKRNYLNSITKFNENIFGQGFALPKATEKLGG